MLKCHFCGSEVEDGGWFDKEKKEWIGIECGCDDKFIDCSHEREIDNHRTPENISLN